MSIVIRGGRIVDPANGVDRQADLLIEEGRVAKIDTGIASAEKEIDARNMLVMPGFVDMHVHLRDPGEEYKEDIASGTRAAAAGGFTSVCCMPNTHPTNDTRSVTEYIVNRAVEVGVVRVFPIGAITKGRAGKALCEYADMRDAGIVAVSDDGDCVMDSALMRRAMEYAATFGLPVIQHCEDKALANGGSINEGLVATRTGLTSQPGQAESIMVSRDIQLAGLTGAAYHAAHLSVAASFDEIRRAKEKGLPVSCEVTPHHFTLTDEVCASYDTHTKVNPPLRGAEDRDALRAAIAEGVVDVIASDHAPHSLLEKEVEYGLADFGISGLETSLALSLELWREKLITLDRLVELLSINPAKIMNLKAGSLASGMPADVVVVDPEKTWTVEPARFASKGRNTPFTGKELKGKVCYTLVAGNVVFGEGE